MDLRMCMIHHSVFQMDAHELCANTLHVHVQHEHVGCVCMLGADLSVFSPSPKLPYLPQPHAYNCIDMIMPS